MIHKNWVWLCYKSVTSRQTLSLDGHLIYQCPCVIQGKLCTFAEKKKNLLRAHVCQEQLTIVETEDESPLAIPSTSVSSREYTLRTRVFGRRRPVMEAFLALLSTRQPSFSFFASPQFNNFIRSIIIEAQQHPDIPPDDIFPRLSYTTVTALVTSEARKIRQLMTKYYRKATVSIAFDGGKIGSKEYTVICVKRVDTVGAMSFFQLKKKHSSKEDFKKLFNDLVEELNVCGAIIATVTIDGEAAQRYALKDLFSVKEYEDKYPNSELRPIHIYCTNHLVN